MITIAKATEELLLESDVASIAAQQGILNYSAFAKRIHREVERRCKKKVTTASVVVAISRFRSKIRKSQQLIPAVRYDAISVQSRLSEITYEKTRSIQQMFSQVVSKGINLEAEFFTVTVGLREISFFISEDHRQDLLAIYRGHKPVLEKRGISAITLKFGPTYIDTPNTTFAFLRPLALKSVNIVEIISTFRELTFLIGEQDLQRSFHILSQFQR